MASWIAAAEDAAHEREHLAVDLLERRGLLGRDVLAACPSLAHLQPEGDGPSRVLLAARRDHAHGDAVDLLEDPRHGRQHGRLDDAELADDLRGVPAPVGDRRADLDAVGLDELGEHVGQRQVEVDDVVRSEQRHLDRRAPPGGEALVRQHDALRAARGARRVDDQAGVVGSDGRGPPVELGRVAACASGGDVRHRHRPLGLAVDDDRVLEVGQPAADRVDLGDLGGVLADDDLGAGVADDPLALVGRVRRVHRHDDRARRDAAARSASVNSTRVLARMPTRSPTPTPSSISPSARSRTWAHSSPNDSSTHSPSRWNVRRRVRRRSARPPPSSARPSRACGCRRRCSCDRRYQSTCTSRSGATAPVRRYLDPPVKSMSAPAHALPHPHRPGTARAAFAYRDFRLIWLGLFASNIGTWMQNFTLPAYVEHRTESAALVGLLVFMQLGPLLLLSIPAGVLADRFPRRPVPRRHAGRAARLQRRPRRARRRARRRCGRCSRRRSSSASATPSTRRRSRPACRCSSSAPTSPGRSASTR